jgi:hypothetical protein
MTWLSLEEVQALAESASPPFAYKELWAQTTSSIFGWHCTPFVIPCTLQYLGTVVKAVTVHSTVACKIGVSPHFAKIRLWAQTTSAILGADTLARVSSSVRYGAYEVTESWVQLGCKILLIITKTTASWLEIMMLRIAMMAQVPDLQQSVRLTALKLFALLRTVWRWHQTVWRHNERNPPAKERISQSKCNKIREDIPFPSGTNHTSPACSKESLPMLFKSFQRNE